LPIWLRADLDLPPPVVEYVAKNACQNDDEVLNVANLFFKEQTVRSGKDSQQQYNSWHESFEHLKEVSNSNQMKNGIAICLQLMQSFLFQAPSSAIYDHDEELDLVSNGIALVARDYHKSLHCGENVSGCWYQLFYDGTT